MFDFMIMLAVAVILAPAAVVAWEVVAVGVWHIRNFIRRKFG
jgi:hypothetical protein